MEILAKLLIGSAMDKSEEVLEQLLSEEFKDYDLDEAFKKLINEENND